MITWFVSVKKYLYLGLAGLLASLAFLTKVFYSRSVKFKKQAGEAKARAKKIEEVMQDDTETEMDHQSRSAEIAKDVKDKGHTDELSNPNDW